MIQLIVLYGLQDDVDEDEFINWRLTEHQKSNEALEGVQRTSFCRLEELQGVESGMPYRFMTTLEWPDRASFEAGFLARGVQKDLQNRFKLLKDAVFMVGEVLSDELVGEESE